MESAKTSQHPILYQIRSKLDIVAAHEDPELIRVAAQCVPHEELAIKATVRLSEVDSELSLEDFVLLELLRWFKYTFFSWMDIPNCEGCGKKSEHRGMSDPSAQELSDGAKKVELFFCSSCKKEIRFPRYNHPGKLLQTRRGRCGEWANCFTLICRAVGLDARLVFDWTDHCWTEVYSEALHRWVHCDPCENVCDRPLMYEIGWKKKLNYIIAFAPDDIQDVTWRYTTDFQAVLSRRKLCAEDFLLRIIMAHQRQLRSQVKRERAEELRTRQITELTEFLTPPSPNPSQSLGGRTSGSLEWRIARGEVHAQSSHVFKARKGERRSFSVSYCCATDKYYSTADNTCIGENWFAQAFSHNSVFRKVEDDWKMVYLARKEGSPKGVISWKFDFSEHGLCIETVKAHIHSWIAESGKVHWFFYPNCDINMPKMYSLNDVMNLKTRDFRGCSSLLISAELSEGNWQHAQLFRQKLDSLEYMFEVEILFSS